MPHLAALVLICIVTVGLCFWLWSGRLHAKMSIMGSVVASGTLQVTAPRGGVVQLGLKPGEQVHPGSTVLDILEPGEGKIPNLTSEGFPTKDVLRDGFHLGGKYLPISSRIGGQIGEIFVKQGEIVRKGEALFSIALPRPGEIVFSIPAEAHSSLQAGTSLHLTCPEHMEMARAHDVRLGDEFVAIPAEAAISGANALHEEELLCSACSPPEAQTYVLLLPTSNQLLSGERSATPHAGDTCRLDASAATVRPIDLLLPQKQVIHK